jgi:hypothetical protein
VRQAELVAEAEAAKAAAAAKAENEARRAAQAAEEARVAREADLAAIAAAEAAARVREAEEAAAREREAAEAAVREAEAREKAAADAAEAERVERGRVAAAIAAAEKKRAEQLAETQRQKEREEAARKAASEKAEKERASAVAEAERRAREAEEVAQLKAAQQAERDRLAEAERAETGRLMALRDAAIRKAAEEEAERARLAAEQAERDRRAAEAEAEAEAQRLAAESAEAQRLMALRDAAVRRAAEEEADRQRLLLEAAAEAIRLAGLAEKVAAEEAQRVQSERAGAARQEAAAAESAREAELAALARQREEEAAEAARLAAAEEQRAAEAAGRERVAREEAEALRLCQLQEQEEEERRAEAQRLEEARLAAEEAEAELAAEEERWRLEEERAAAERPAEQERVETERLVAEERATAERAEEEQRVAKLAAERAAARVAAEKEAQRQRAAQQAEELAARQAAAEAAKAAALEKRNARLAAEKAAREEAEQRRLAQERERAERLEDARAARAAAAQQALAEARERAELEADARERAELEADAREQQKRAEAELAAAQDAADADVFALASTVSTPPASESAASPGVEADAESPLPLPVPSNGSAHTSVLGAIEAERDVSPPPPPPPLSIAVTAAAAPAAPSQLTRNDSWRTAQVPFHRSSAQKWGPLGSSLAQIKQVQAPRYRCLSFALTPSPVVLSFAFQPSIRAATAQPPRSPSVAFDASADTNQKPRKSPVAAPTASARSPAPRTSPAAAPKSTQRRATSPSPVKSALHRTPTSTTSRRSLHTPRSAAAGHLTAMDSVHLDLATPLPQTVKGQHPDREHTATSGRRASAASTAGSQSARAYSAPKATHMQREAQTATASAQRPHQGGLGDSLRSSSTGRSVTFARAKSPLDLTRDDSDPVPPLTEEEMQRRAARAERLQRIHYPHLHRSPSRGKVLPTGEESAAARQQAAVDGLLEAFAQLSVPSTSSISGLNMGTAVGRVPHSSLRARSTTPETARIPAASPPPSERSRTLHSTRSGRFLSPQRDGTPSRRGLAEMERLYNEVVAAAHKPVVQRCGENLAILFRRLKETNQNSSSKNNDDSVISTALTKGCIKKLGLVEGNVFHASDAEILLSRLGVKSLTVFGFALALTLCAERALCSEENSLDALGFTDKAASFRIGSSFYRGSGDAAGRIVSSYLNVVDYLSRKIDVLFRKMDAEHVRKSAFNPLDEYREITPEQQLEVVTLLEREKKVFFTIYESYLPGTKRAFADIKSALTVAPLSGGLPFSGVVSFCRDFELSPELLSRPQLLEIFNSILLAEKALVLRRTAVEGAGSEMDGDAGAGSRSAKKQSLTPSGSAKKGGLRQEPPLSDSISFPQVMLLCVLSAVLKGVGQSRCSGFELATVLFYVIHALFTNPVGCYVCVAM